MVEPDRITIACRIARSAFSEERVFYVPLAGGGEHVGAASRQYCFTRKHQPLEEEQPTRGKTMDGRIAAILIREEGDHCLVSLPDGEVVMVRKDQASELKEGTPR